MNTVEVKLGSRGYQIVIEPASLDHLGRHAAERASGARRAVLVTNERVEDLYGRRARRSLKAAGFSTRTFIVGDGERFKSLRTADAIYEFLIEQRVERGDLMVALGGGVVGDLAGFVAGTYLRGIRLVQVPTTLLAQIDSSVGGKTGVNHKLGKNLIGVFHQPSLVVIDPETLRTLPPREVTAGLCEAVKYGVIRSRALFDRIVREIEQLKKLEIDEVSQLIARCCEIKADVVRRDEREGGLRRILNFGHTIGHALEATTGYRRFLHGEAVGHGMRAASLIAERIGLLSDADRRSIDAAVALVGRLPRANNLALDDIISAMRRDKKSEAGRNAMVLPTRIGQVVIRSDVPPRVVLSALKQALG